MTTKVFHESIDDLGRDLQRFEVTPCADGVADVDGTVDGTGSLMRALFRAEAELLVADALAMGVGTYVPREPHERRHDALLLILQRLRYLDTAA